MMTPIDSMPPIGRAPFWESRWLWLAMACAALVPFLGVTILPFNDLPNHVGRHFIFLNIADDPFLQRFYTLHWALIGNLGIDLIVRAIGPWLGADLGTHVAVACIPPLAIAGIYSLSRALAGRVLPSSLLAATLVLNWPLITGFANFSLSAAIALLVLALWIRLRSLHVVWRLCIFTPLVFCTWVAHTAGWGLLGLGIAAYELSRATAAGIDLKRLLVAAAQLVVFVPTFVFIVLWRQRASNGAAINMGDDFWKGKVIAVLSLFREHFVVWDLFTMTAFFALLSFFYLQGGRRFVRPALMITATFLLAFIACPQDVFKSGFADRRLLTYGAMLLPLAVGLAPGVLLDPRRRLLMHCAALASLGLFVARIGVATVVWHEASRSHEEHLALIDAVPVHSRIFGLVVESCGQSWNRVGRPDHIQQYALVRRDSVINGIYQNPGLNQVEALFGDDAAPVDPDMYAVVHDASCPVPYIKQTLQSAMRDFPRDKFDYVWLIGEQPLGTYDEHGLRLVRQAGSDRLYRVVGGN